jgi:4-hydroxy-tetrahydrodipicolinate synthase
MEMNDGKVDWKGSYVAVITPFTREREIDLGAFQDNLEFLLGEGAHGLVVSGCTGESWSLTSEEKLQLFKVAVDVAGPRVPVIAGTGFLQTDVVIELSRQAREIGTAGIMILPPYYCRPGAREILAHYQAVSDEVGHPILLYNIPSRVGRDMTPDLIEQLAAVEWVVAIKESSDTFLRVEQLIANVGDQINVFAGHSAERGVPSVLMGAKGFVSSMESQIMGGEAISMYDLIQQGRIEEAAKVQLKTLRLDQAMRTVGTFPANLKAGMTELGRVGGYPRPPLLELDQDEVQRVAEILSALEIEAVATPA